jgi:hypothetical protein
MAGRGQLVRGRFPKPERKKQGLVEQTRTCGAKLGAHLTFFVEAFFGLFLLVYSFLWVERVGCNAPLEGTAPRCKKASP